MVLLLDRGGQRLAVSLPGRSSSKAGQAGGEGQVQVVEGSLLAVLQVQLRGSFQLQGCGST